MSNWAHVSVAFSMLREASATRSTDGAAAIAGSVRVRAIAAAPSTPHRTVRMFLPLLAGRPARAPRPIDSARGRSGGVSGAAEEDAVLPSPGQATHDLSAFPPGESLLSRRGSGPDHDPRP